MFDSDPFVHFQRVNLEVFLGQLIFFYFGTIFQSEELFDKYNGDHEYHEQCIPHVLAINERRTCFPTNPIVRNLIGSTSKIALKVEDMTMDVIQRSHVRR